MRRRALFIALPLVTLLAAPAVAEPISMTDAVRQAVERDPSLAAAGLQIAAARTAVDAASGAFDLQITGRLDGSTARQTVVNPMTGRTRFETRRGALNAGLIQPLVWGTRLGLNWTNDLTATDNPFLNCVPGIPAEQCYETSLRLSVTQPLLQGFGREVNTAAETQAREGVRAAEFDRLSTAEALVEGVVGAYIELNYAREALTIREQALELAREQLKNTEAQIEVGRMAPVDRAVVAQAAARRQQDLAGARLSVADRAGRLSSRLGRGAAPETERPALDAFAGAMEPALANAEARSATLAGLDAAHAQLQAQRVLRIDARRPRLDLTLIAAQQGLDEGWGGALANLPANDTHFYGATLDFAWTPSATSANAELAGLDARIAANRAQRQAAVEDLRVQIGEAVRAAAAADETATLSAEVATLAARALEAEQQKFETGRATNLDVLQVQQDLAEAQLAVARAEADRWLARTRLQRLTGGLLAIYGLSLEP